METRNGKGLIETTEKGLVYACFCRMGILQCLISFTYIFILLNNDSSKHNFSGLPDFIEVEESEDDTPVEVSSKLQCKTSAVKNTSKVYM